MQHKCIPFKAFLHKKREKQKRKTIHNLCHLKDTALNDFEKSKAELKRKWQD